MSFWDILFLSYLGPGTLCALVSVVLFRSEKNLVGLYIVATFIWPFYLGLNETDTFRDLLRRRTAGRRQDVLRKEEQLEQDYQEVLKLIEWKPLEERLTQHERPLC